MMIDHEHCMYEHIDLIFIGSCACLHTSVCTWSGGSGIPEIKNPTGISGKTALLSKPRFWLLCRQSNATWEVQDKKVSLSPKLDQEWTKIARTWNRTNKWCKLSHYYGLCQKFPAVTRKNDGLQKVCWFHMCLLSRLSLGMNVLQQMMQTGRIQMWCTHAMLLEIQLIWEEMSFKHFQEIGILAQEKLVFCQEHFRNSWTPWW